MSRIIKPPRQRDHWCSPPWQSGGYGGTGEPDGTVWVCDCGRAWFSAPCYEHYGPVSHWRSVRWYHWRLRRRIRGAP